MTNLPSNSDQTQTQVAPTLNEAEPESLNELFSRDPMHLTEQDIETICTALRKQRVNWDVKDSNTKKVKQMDDAVKNDLIKKLDVDSLELDI